MKKFFASFILGILLLFSSYYFNKILAQTSDRIIDQNLALTALGINRLGIKITYENGHAVGDPYPNYEYSGHLLKMAPNDWRMIYGARCYYDADKNCQIPVNGAYPNPNPSGGDGDHPLYASSTDGTNWNMTRTPLVRKGMYEGVSSNNYDYNNHMDPTIIKWNNLYYMYYQVQVTSDENSNCPKDPNQTVSGCDRILYATSTNLIDWTKGQPLGEPVIKDSRQTNGWPIPQDSFAWPKAIVTDGEIWLYFGYFRYGYGGQFIGPRVIRSTNPTQFDLVSARSISGYGGWSQHGILWPNDPSKRLFVGIVNNWSITNGTGPYAGHKIPTLAFSKNGLDWISGDSNTTALFPPVMNNLEHEFCNIGTEVNGGLNPISSNPNVIETFYFCSNMNGENASVWNADLAVGKITFSIPLSGDLDQNNTINIFDYNILVQNFARTGAPGFTPADIDRDGDVDIFDYNILVGNFGRSL